MKLPWRTWGPPSLLVAGVGLSVFGVQAQRALALRQPLGASVPAQMDGYRGRDVSLSDEEQRVAGVTDYLVRAYAAPDTTDPGFSIYVGYYDRQTQGRTIHSPKNCLPGAGWEPLTSSRAEIAMPSGAVPVNRYLLQRGAQRALVLYWYQGRGRVAANEYLVKWDLLRDAALRRRSDEALVRVIVPVTTTEAGAFALASRVAQQVVPALNRSLPL